ncbi:MAG: dienelactone hydrolase family protein [Fimbriimonadales bacterium]
MNRLLILITCLIFAGSLLAQDWAKARLANSPRHQEWVELTQGTRKLKCFVVYPERKDKATVVVLIHEIMGLTDWVMSVADQLAEHGYIAIAPDFVSGMAPNGGRTTDFEDVGKVREAISGLPADQVTADLNAACDYGKKLPSANGKLVVGGFCWGGGQTFRFATNRTDLSASLAFYGTGPTDPAAIAKINAPVYGFYGGNDNRVNATIPDSEKLMKEAKKKYEPVTYEGAGHGFMRAGEAPDASEANKKARDSAWKRILEILKAIR